MFLFTHKEGIPDHPFDSNIKRSVFVQILSQNATIDKDTLDVASVSGFATINLEVFHYTVDENNDMKYMHKDLFKVVQLTADNEETMNIPGIGDIPDFEALTMLLNSKQGHIKDLIFGVVMDRFTPTVDGQLSKLDIKLGY